MKILLRTLIILAAALVVVGGLYAFAQSPAGQAMGAAGPGGHAGGPPAGFENRRFEGAPAAGLPGGEGRGGFPGGEGRGGFDGREGRGGHGPSLLGLVEVGKNLAIVAVSVILVTLGARLLRLGRRERV